MPNVLTLNLKTVYFNQIKAGTKTEEYRLCKPFWKQRLENCHYDAVHILRGYPPKEDESRRLVFPWRGYSIKIITHPHFGDEPVLVYAIRLSAVNEAIMNPKPLLYDLFCKAGGCTRGYQDAGFYVVGVDKAPQPRYIGDEFIQMDALEFLRRLLAGEYPRPVMVSASPPCQAYSMTSNLSNNNHPELIEPVRDLLKAIGLPYVIENVPGAPLSNPLMLCGTMFGLLEIRHRLFECDPIIWMTPMTCNHHRPVVKHGRPPDHSRHFHGITGHFSDVAWAKEIRGTPWMNQEELSQAIPPTYTAWLGRQMLAAIAEAGI